jgi:hypothetical protein
MMKEIQDRHLEGPPRLAILDDQLDGLEVTREKLALELAAMGSHPDRRDRQDIGPSAS